MSTIILIVGLGLFPVLLTAQEQPVNKKRLNAAIIGGAGLYTASMVGLGTIWYQDLGKFHLFNDNRGWGYMDKLGHSTTAYQIGRLGTRTLEWTGMDHKKATWYGGMSGLLFLTSIEIFDGMSEDWGFSMGDVVANTLGTALFISQELIWKEQQFMLKWSYTSSPYAQYRPELLGASSSERWLKDYNGQTYWLSTNLHSTLFRHSAAFPKWLNLAIGYGIEGYTGADSNPFENAAGEEIPLFDRYSQYYLSLDIDLTRIETRMKWLRAIFQVLNIVKVPLPGVEYSAVQGWRYHWFAF